MVKNEFSVETYIIKPIIIVINRRYWRRALTFTIGSARRNYTMFINDLVRFIKVHLDLCI